MKIIFATDGSSSANAAADWLSEILPPESEVSLLTVCETTELPSDEDAPGALAHLHEALHSETDRMLAETTKRLSAPGRTVETVRREGRPASEITSYADEVGAQLIALGSRGLSGFKEYLLGSVSTKVVEQAHCSVLVIRPPQADGDPTTLPPQSPLKVLLAINRRDVAAACIQSVATLGREKGFQVDCLRVLLHIPQLMSELSTSRSELDRQKEAAEKSLAEACTKLQDAGVAATPHLVIGEDAAETIIDCSKNWSSGLVVLGSREKSVLERFLLGSVSNEVLHNVSCPVLIVKGKGLTSDE